MTKNSESKRVEAEFDVYIKIRVELMKSDMSGINNGVFVMSFHYAEHPFTDNQFPYKKAGV